ncbi:TrmH family RNA methyltransferase [Lewinella sp. LCG006]|uniref:TrmH family RNA methyltransferase n=1 Tax=Lewinella sp. LCG006 TaxID=3231911 RepID=UPI00346023D4
MALSKNTIKTLTALHRKKFRQKYNNFIAEGDKIVGELIRQRHYPVQEVFALPAWLEVNEPLLQENSIPFSTINDAELRLISQLTSPNQVLAVVGQPLEEKTVDWSDNWSLYLDGLQDPGNVGTILRIADWFAIPRVIAGPGTVELFNAKVLQATMGAFLRVQWITQSLSAIRSNHPTLPIWAADMAGEDIFKLEAPKAGILVIGNEGQGVSEQVKAMVDQQVAIIAPHGSGAESLNAGVATGILCAALRRGRA